MPNKKGIELAISTLVIMIISILLFGLSIYLVKQMFSGATQISDTLDKQTQLEIERLMKQENSIVSIPYASKKAAKGGMLQFPIGIRNTGNDAKFCIVTSFDSASTLDRKVILKNPDKTYINTNWVGNLAISPLMIPASQFATRGIMIKQSGSISQTTATPQGVYSFDVCVFTTTATACDLTALRKTCQSSTALTTFYTSKIYQISVEVD